MTLIKFNITLTTKLLTDTIRYFLSDTLVFISNYFKDDVMSNPCMPTQHKQQPTATCLPNTEQNRTTPAFFLGKPTHVKDVESKQTPGFLSSTYSLPLNIGNSQLRNFSVQDIEKCKKSKQWKTPTESTISPESSSTNSTSVQGTIENQNSWPTPDESVAWPTPDESVAWPTPDESAAWPTPDESAASHKHYQPDSTPVQSTIGNQNLNFRSALAKPAAIPKCSKPSSASVQDTTKEQSSKSWPNHSTAKFTRPSTKTPQRNSYTDEAVNTLITEVNNLYYSDNKDINRRITQVFNNFKRGASYLTDDHRKQLLSIIPTISEIIDTRNLDSISITSILHSLTKTNAYCSLNPRNTPIDKYIQYKQACKNLISKILTIQIYKKQQPRSWSITLYSLGELAETSPNLINSEQINNLMANLNIQKQSLTEFNHHNISDIFVAIVKLLKFNKLDSHSIATHSFLTYLLQQIKPAIGDFTTQSIASTLLSIDKLAKFPDFIQLISDKQDIIKLLLEVAITNENLYWKPIDVSQVIYTLGMITDYICLNKKVTNIVKEAYHTLYSKVPFMVSKYDMLSANFLLRGIIKLMRSNTITSNKPSKSLIRDIFLEKIIADTSIINNHHHLYRYLHTMAYFQAYLTKNELIKILENIIFFIPDINEAKSYFTAMGYLLAKIRKEIANDKKNRKLIVLEHLIETEIKKAWLHLKPNIDSFNMSLITAIHNTCSLIYKAEDLTLLKVSYEGEIHGSTFEETNLAIIKTLIPDPENLKIEYRINNNLPPVDACIIQPDGSMLAIEIQGTGHYLDDEGEYPTGKHLLKSARLQIENIQVIEVSGIKLMSNNKPKYIASHLINILLENNVKIRPEYCNNIPKLLRDSGFTSK